MLRSPQNLVLHLTGNLQNLPTGALRHAAEVSLFQMNFQAQDLGIGVLLDIIVQRSKNFMMCKNSSLVGNTSTACLPLIDASYQPRLSIVSSDINGRC